VQINKEESGAGARGEKYTKSTPLSCAILLKAACLKKQKGLRIKYLQAFTFFCILY
jgi:hypothetical protein